MKGKGIQDLVLMKPTNIILQKCLRRHTNFSIECIEQTFNLNPSAEGSTITSILKEVVI